MQVTRLASVLAGTLALRRLLSTLDSRRFIMETDTLGIDLANPSTPCHGFIRRPAMARLARLVSAAGAAVLIAACGGGGGDTTATATAADPIDQYIGHWAVCIPDPARNASARLEFIATKIGATQASSLAQAIGFPNIGCAPPVAIIIPIPEFSGIVVIDFPASGPVGADKVTFRPSDTAIPPSKDITLVLNGIQLQFGDGASPTDAQGYPTALDTSITFTKQ